MAAKRAEQKTAAKPLTATDLIAKRSAEVTARELPPEGALLELGKLIEENDKRRRGERITAEDAMQMLASWGWNVGRTRFSQVVKLHFGRRWEA